MIERTPWGGMVTKGMAGVLRLRAHQSRRLCRSDALRSGWQRV